LSMMSRKTPVVSWRRCVAHTHSLVNHHQSSSNYQTIKEAISLVRSTSVRSWS
jgi:hypothetical protein